MPMNRQTIYALGFFDGVHLGHQALLTQTRRLAAEKGCAAGAVTFTSHPGTLVSGTAPKLINTIADRADLLREFGADNIIELPFDDTLRNTDWSVFLTKLAEQGAAGFVCGSDFRFGANGSGTAEKLASFCEERNLAYSIVPQQLLDGVRVSSTHIRGLLEEGNIADANRFLGHAHILTGTVTAGRGLGHTIGVPTANVLLPPELVQPKLGVYACLALVEGKHYPAVTNIGSRPTVGGHQVRAESWLLNFAGDLYGKSLTLRFCDYLRPEKKFENLDALVKQIHKDAEKTRKTLEKS